MLACWGEDPAKQVGQLRLQRSVISISMLQLWLAHCTESADGEMLGDVELAGSTGEGAQLLPQQDVPGSDGTEDSK